MSVFNSDPPVVFVTVAGVTVSFPGADQFRNPASVGLSGYDIQFIKTGPDSFTGIINNLQGLPTTFSVTMITASDAKYDLINANGFIFLNTIAGGAQLERGGVIYSLLSQRTGDELIVQSTLFLNNLILPPIPGGASLPLLEATTLQLTTDGEVICQLGYRVVTEKGICPDIDCAITQVTETFTQYCINYRSLLLSQKDVVRLNEYVALRLIFSSLLCCPPFDKFNVRLLKRKYYQPFLIALGKSQFRAALAFFTDQEYGFTQYWRLFQ